MREPVAVRRLEEVATIEREGITANAISRGTLYVGLEHIDSDGSFVNVKGVDVGELASNKFRFGPSHILFGKLRPYLKKTARPDFDGICSTDVLPILPGPKLNRDYLFHYLRHPKVIEQAVLRSTGANLPRLSPRELAKFEVPVPPLAEQRRIADYLDKADAIRRKRKDVIVLTEELLRSIFLEMFGDPVTNPRGWRVEPLGKYLGFVTSGSRGWAEHYTDHGDRFIRSVDVQMDRIAEEDAAYVIAPPGAEAERTRVREDDVLLTITGSRIGRVARATGQHTGAFVSQHVAILRLLPGLDADVAAAYLVSDRGGQALIARSQYGQTKPGLNLAQIRAFPIPVPPTDIQQQIRSVRARLKESQERLAVSLSDSEELFVSLSKQAFGGISC